MLSTLDRILVVVRERRPAVAAQERLLGAALLREDRVGALAARRSVMRVGASEIELLEPDGAGPVADFLARTRGGLYGVGFAAPHPIHVRERLDSLGVPCFEDGAQLRVDEARLGIPGLRVVVSQQESREPAGLLRGLYEATLLVEEVGAPRARLAAAFGLEPGGFVSIRSEAYGYDGTLTLFDSERLDRLEIVHPFDGSKTMGRFFAKRGPCLYMAYGECDDTAALRTRLLEHAPQDWTGPSGGGAPDNLFVHPAALGGFMLGVSRTSFAWTWSGHPERVRAAHGGGSA